VGDRVGVDAGDRGDVSGGCGANRDRGHAANLPKQKRPGGQPGRR
jgi:hypothetical protein